MTVHRTQVSGESGASNGAAFQIVPPSVLYSTLLIPRVPANATPAMVTGPSRMISPSCGVSKRAVVLITALWSQPCCSQ